MNLSRITILAGHYGSGKTQIALNLALLLKQKEENVALADLDIVNPYFRSGDHGEMLEKAGIRLIASSFAGSNLETSGFAPEAASVIDDKSGYFILDVGGDNAGAVALGRFASGLRREKAEMYLVVNMYRPLTRTVEDTVLIKREIEEASRCSFTGIINNSNIGKETTKEDILRSLPFARELSAALDLPLVCTASAVRIEDIHNEIPKLLNIHIYDKKAWEI